MSAYSAAVLADAPVHYWRCADPGGGLGHDIGSSPIAIHGLGTAISAPFGYSGPVSDGGSMDLALVGQYANTGNPITVQTNPMSLECLYWNWQDFNTFCICLQVQSTNQITLLWTGTVWEFVYNGAVVTTNHNGTAQHWHHLVATYDGTNARLYVDAFAAGPTAVAPQAAISQIFEIGANFSLANFGQGFFAEVAIYASALSAARVTAHFNAIDQIGTVPVFQAAAGTPGGGTTQLANILAAVQKTYQNAP